MARFILPLTVVLCGLAGRAPGHFVFVVPAADGTKASIVLSEDLQPDAEVNLLTAANVRFAIRDSAGRDTDVSFRKVADDRCEMELPGSGWRAVHGACDLGLMKRGDSPAFLLVYHPKTILGDAFDRRAVLGESERLEIVPAGKPGALSFRVLAHGKPVPDVEVNLVLPNGEQQKVKTDANGQTGVFNSVGRYGAWARSIDETPGEKGGQAYAAVRHYATLVVDVVD